MAINKKLIHFNLKSVFNSKKLSANAENTQYQIGGVGTTYDGAPDINYQSIVYIKDTQEIWTHGQLYPRGITAQIIRIDYILSNNTYNIYHKGIALTTEKFQEILRNSDTASDKYITIITYNLFNDENVNSGRTYIGIAHSDAWNHLLQFEVNNDGEHVNCVLKVQNDSLVFTKDSKLISGENIVNNSITDTQLARTVQKKLVDLCTNFDEALHEGVYYVWNNISANNGSPSILSVHVYNNIIQQTHYDNDGIIKQRTSTDSGNTWPSWRTISTHVQKDDLFDYYAEEVVNKDALTQVTREELKKDLFIDLWNRACINNGQYNSTTGFFELNGLTDITYEQAIDIYNYHYVYLTNVSALNTGNSESKIRTNIPIPTFGYISGDSLFRLQVHMEVVNFCPQGVNNPDNVIVIYSPVRFLSGMVRLKKVIGVVKFTAGYGSLNTHEAFYNDVLLEEVKIITPCNVNFQNCPKLNLSSLQYLVNNAINTEPITITVHQTVYNKLTDTTNTDWNAVFTAAQAKNISFVIP